VVAPAVSAWMVKVQSIPGPTSAEDGSLSSSSVSGEVTARRCRRRPVRFERMRKNASERMNWIQL